MKRRKEYGPSDFHKMLLGLRQAAEQVHREEFNKIVAPAPVQSRLPFMDDERPELPKEKYDAPIGSSADSTTSDALALTDHDRNFLNALRIEIPEDARWPLDGSNDDTATGFTDPEAAE
jgi:hypothetical protein